MLPARYDDDDDDEKCQEPGRNRHGVMVNVLECDIVVSEFKLLSHYYVQFWINTLGKSIEASIIPARYELNNATTVLQGRLLEFSYLRKLICH